VPKTVKRTILDWHNLASEYGGQCLSEKAGRSTDPLRWKCAEGHAFTARPANILDGHWCPVCGRIVAGTTRHRKAIARVEAIIKEKKGKLLTPPSEIDSMAYSLINVACPAGHTWTTKPSIVKSGSWCPACAKNERARKRTVPLSDLRAYAASKGGRIVKVVRGVGMRGVYLLKCQFKAHPPWKSHGWSLKHYWCPLCENRRRGRPPASKPTEII
jgi:hypothetical protein